VTGGWNALPSGLCYETWGDLVGYVVSSVGTVYWWVTRNGRTIIEGPAASIELGKLEVECAVREFRRV